MDLCMSVQYATRPCFPNQIKPCKRWQYSKDLHVAAVCLTGQYIYGCGSECAPSCLVPVGKKEEQICYICDSHVLRGQVSSIAIANKMALSPIPVELHELNALEWQLIAKILPFTKIISLCKRTTEGSSRCHCLLAAWSWGSSQCPAETQGWSPAAPSQIKMEH